MLKLNSLNKEGVSLMLWIDIIQVGYLPVDKCHFLVIYYKMFSMCQFHFLQHNSDDDFCFIAITFQLHFLIPALGKT